MEKERANRGVGFFAYARHHAVSVRGFSPIFITAAVSVLILGLVLGWEMSQSVGAMNPVPPLSPTEPQGMPPGFGESAGYAPSAPGSATSSDPISTIGATVMQQLEGAYEQMQQAGVYSSSTAELAGQSLAPYVAASVPYPNFSPGDIQTDHDISYARMLRYRADLRTSLSPLLKNTQPEYEIFAQYVDTKDVSYLSELKQVAQQYRDAADLTARIVVPQDALNYHIAILNAMEEFGATLDALAAHADDPFASVALLRGYNQAEADMLTSFNALTTYYKSKHP